VASTTRQETQQELDRLLDRIELLIARQLLDRPRQTSTEPPLTTCAGGVKSVKLDSSTDIDADDGIFLPKLVVVLYVVIRHSM